MAVVAMTFSLGLTTAVLVAGSASAAAPKKKTTTPPKSPAERYLVVNGTANAASARVVGGSSAFPNFKTGAIDNYYSMAHAHVDNSPFAQGTASPLDTGPVGQTAAAGHFQQPQYADARWPGDGGKATYGKQGEPYATASASEYRATAEASEASHGLSGPSGSGTMAVPKELDDRLRQVLAAWKADWLNRPDPAKPTAPTPTPKPPVTIPKAPVATPKATITTPIATLPAPDASNSTAPVPVPPPAVSPPALPSGSSSTPSRSLASAAAPRDGLFLLESSTLTTLDPKTNALVTSGESTLGRVSLGGGQIVIEDIQVSASITNDGAAPAHKVAVSVGAAKIGGVPVTIDQDGVHVVAQRQGLPYQQASDALNNALKTAGIRLFLVAPQITTNGCDGAGTSSDKNTSTSTTSTASDQSGSTSTMGSSCESGAATTCEPAGTGTGTTTNTNTTTTANTTTSPGPSPIPTAPSSDRSDTNATTTSSCGEEAPATTTSSCEPPGTATGTTTTTSKQAGTTTTAASGDQTSTYSGTTSSGGMTISATGLHVAFAQPAPQSGVPAQHAELILGEVFLDSLAVPGVPLPDLDLSSPSSSSSSSSASSACPGGGRSSGTTSGGAAGTGGGSSSVGGSTGSSSLSSSGSGSASAFGSTSQPVSGSTGNMSLPAAFAAALTKPLWLLLAYVLWQALVIGTGVSLWNWRRGDVA